MVKAIASEELERRLLVELGSRVRLGGFVYPLLLVAVALQVKFPGSYFWIFWFGTILVIVTAIWRTMAANRAAHATTNWRSIREEIRVSSLLLTLLMISLTSIALAAAPHSDFSRLILFGLISWTALGCNVFAPDLSLAKVFNLVSMIPFAIWCLSVRDEFGWFSALIFGISWLFLWIAAKLANTHLKKMVMTQIQLESQADDLRNARDSAEEASRARTQFLANMSHEIRTPLNGIIGVTDLMLGTELSHEQRELVGIMSQSGNHLLTLVNDLLDLSKINAGKLMIESVEFDVRHLLDETCRPMQLQAESKGLDWHMQIRKEVPQICLGDPVRIRQVLSNLMSNALKFTDRGGVTLDVGMVDGNLVRFIVEDTGIGIESAKLDGIFEEFEQADRSTTRRFGGTGLGLAISKKLVELMGGRIGVQSAVGQGSVFWFELATSGNRS
jgi:signal transduction histidine kinase